MEVYRVTPDSPEWQKKAYDYVRTDAFVFGQNIPMECEFNGDSPEDEKETVVLIDGHKPVAGCRLQYPEEGIGKIGRVCVIRERQRTGIGHILIAEAEKWIAEKEIHHIVINSQDRAEKFYERCGYVLVPGVNPEIYERHHHDDAGGEKAAQEEKRAEHPDLGFSCVLVEKYI